MAMTPQKQTDMDKAPGTLDTKAVGSADLGMVRGGDD